MKTLELFTASRADAVLVGEAAMRDPTLVGKLSAATMQ
jgi:tRNA-dihydrouridine synthase